MAIPKFKLSPEAVKQLQEMQTDIDDLNEEIKRASEVGIDLAEVKTSLDEAVRLREGLLKLYT